MKSIRENTTQSNYLQLKVARNGAFASGFLEELFAAVLRFRKGFIIVDFTKYVWKLFTIP